MSEEFGKSRFERAWETPEEVILRRELIRTPGLQPEDLGVLAELLLRDPWLPSTMEAIRRDLQAQGWKMGKDRYNAIAGRLTKAGHLARIPAYDEATQRPTWVTRVYRNPANNDQYVDLGITESMQVNAETRVSRDPEPEPRSGSRETRVSPGQSRNAENPRSGAGSRETRDPETRVSPGQSRNAENPRSGSPPPHPPEEVTTSSPYPLTDTTGHMPAAPGEEAEVFDTGETAAAVRFVQTLPQPWCVGRLKAKAIGPVLLEAMAEQGWPKLSEMNERTRGLLVEQLTKNPVGVRNHGLVLERDRVPNLPLFDVVAGPGGSVPAQGSRSGPGPVPAPDPGYKPVPAPAEVAALLAGLRKPTV
ncbi:hypothetical protein [Streptomyces sp. cmx-10-25]|uniref:hypothetical protein n=1 Tax=Streptomyces sp. cmx-10-25 TaxID=2790919 RepID=UPI00397E9DBD